MTAPPAGLIDYHAVLADLEARREALDAAIDGVTLLLAQQRTEPNQPKETPA